MAQTKVVLKSTLQGCERLKVRTHHVLLCVWAAQRLRTKNEHRIAKSQSKTKITRKNLSALFGSIHGNTVVHYSSARVASLSGVIVAWRAVSQQPR